MRNKITSQTNHDKTHFIQTNTDENTMPFQDDRIIVEEGLAKKIAHICQSTIHHLGYQMIWVELAQDKGHILRITAQRSDGTFSLDDCTKISRALSPLLEVNDPVNHAYNLEISSAGSNRHLVRQNDFEMYIGFEIRVELKQMQAGRKKIRARLQEVSDTFITLAVDENNTSCLMTIRYDEMRTARVIATQELLDYLMKVSH